MTPNRHQRRALEAMNRKGKTSGSIAPDFTVCGLGGCTERATATRIQGGKVLGTFCDGCLGKFDEAENYLRSVRREAELAALPFWRRLGVRLYLAWQTWRVRRAAARALPPKEAR